MPFCTTCGAEVAADKKFCVQCGAPMEPVTGPAVPVTPSGPGVAVSPPAPFGALPVQSKKTKTTLIIGGIVVVLVILAAVYFVGMPMLKANQKSAGGFTPSPTSSVTYTVMQTAQPTPQYTMEIPETTIVPETPALPVQVRDERFEEEYERIFTINQMFSFGQKVNFDHDLTLPPLYIQFNLTPTQITRHRLVSIGTHLEHYENTTETNPLAWFEVKVLDAGSGAVIDQQGFGKDYPDVTKRYFMVRQKGNYRIEMSGNEVMADVQIMTGTP